MSPSLPLRRATLLLATLTLAGALSGCAVAMVGGAAVAVVGVAADVTVGAVKLTGKAVGAAADLVLPSKAEDRK